jgi:hypothetical protein
MGANKSIEDIEATLLAATKSALDELVWWATRRWQRRPLKRHFRVLIVELDGLPWQGDTCMITPDEAGSALLILALPETRTAPEFAVSLHLRDRPWIGGVLVDRERARIDGVRLSDRLAEEPLRV